LAFPTFSFGQLRKSGSQISSERHHTALMPRHHKYLFLQDGSTAPMILGHKVSGLQGYRGTAEDADQAEEVNNSDVVDELIPVRSERGLFLLWGEILAKAEA
jgi:hypothetical protein